MVELLVTYLDMTASPSGAELKSPDDTVCLKRENLSLTDYLDLYHAVGASLDWDLQSGRGSRSGYGCTPIPTITPKRCPSIYVPAFHSRTADGEFS